MAKNYFSKKNTSKRYNLKKLFFGGLIKQKIVCQTEEELSTHKGQDLDELMLQLAIERRNQVAVEWQKLGKNINPLVLIQLPNDDSELEKQGVATKETVAAL